MRNSLRLICSASIALAVCFSNDTLLAQPAPNQSLPPRQARQAPPPTSSTGSRVAVIDIGYVFKNHTRFKQMMEDMRNDVQVFEGKLKENGAELQKMRAQLQENRPGTPDYKKLEEQIAGFQAQVQAKTQLKRKEFLENEARIYYNVYNEIVKEVSYFSQRQGIDLVVRFNSEQIDPQNRKSVLEGVNRAVVYQNRLNITYEISERLNRGTRPPEEAARTPAKTIPRRRTR